MLTTFLLVTDDQFRVVLEKLPGDSYSDYINATFIDVSIFIVLF